MTVKYRYREPLPSYPTQKVSIVLVTHDPDSWQIACAIAALSCQTHHNWELLIAHDGFDSRFADDMSTNTIVDQVRVYMETAQTGDWGYHIRSKYEAMCTGDWIGGMCDDDWMAPVYLEELLHAANSQEASFAQCDYLHNYSQWAEIHKGFPVVGHVGIGGWIAKRELVLRHPHATFTETADGDRVFAMSQDPEFRPALVERALYVHG
jgi:hypothetical protein